MFLAAGEVNCVPHHQKESRETKAADDAELVLDLLYLRVGELAPSLVRALIYFLAKESGVAVTLGNGELRQGGPQPGKIEVALPGNPIALLQTLLSPLPPLGQFLRRE
jgi:hypothetical protein